MKVLRPGHRYELEAFEPDGKVQTIQFIEKIPATDVAPGEPPGKLITVYNGTTTEEVLEVVLNRMQNLQGQFPCKENAMVITKLEEALLWLEKRTNDRKKRGVEGKQIA